MSTQILMPALSPTMTEGKLAKWLKKVGDDVKAGDVIAEIETDKATMEVEAVDEGKLLKILVEEGTEGVAVNTVIAMLGAEGESTAAKPEAPKPAPQAPEPQKPPTDNKQSKPDGKPKTADASDQAKRPQRQAVHAKAMNPTA